MEKQTYLSFKEFPSPCIRYLKADPIADAIKRGSLRGTPLTLLLPKVALFAEQSHPTGSPDQVFKTSVPSPDWQNEKMQALKNPLTSEREKALILIDLHRAFENYIKYIARSRWSNFHRIRGDDGLQDIIAAGKAGFVDAIKKWSPSYGKPLIFLASTHIAQSCGACCKQLAEGIVRYPPKHHKLLKDYKEAMKMGLTVYAELLLEESKSRPETKNIVRAAASTSGPENSSFDAPISEESDGTLADVLPSDHNQDRHHEISDMLACVRRTILKLPSRKRLIFFLKFPNVLSKEDVGPVDFPDGTPIPVPDYSPQEANLVDISNHMKITRERVRQVLAEIQCLLRSQPSLKADLRGFFA